MDGHPAMHLFHRDYGHGPRKAIALHCSLSHSGSWKRVATCLEDQLTIRAFDLPSHGKSPDWDGAGDLTWSIVEAVIPYLTEPVDLIGHSLGALVSLHLALERPEMVRSLSLFEPVLMSIADEDDKTEAAWNHALMDEVAAAVAQGDPETAARTFMRVWGDGRKWADLPQELREGSTQRIEFIGTGHPRIGWDLRQINSRLGQINVPAVLMDGLASPRMIQIVQDGIAARIPGARRVTIEGAGHMGPITHAAEVAREIAVTLAEVG